MWGSLRVSRALSLGGFMSFGAGPTVDNEPRRTCPIQVIQKIEAKDNELLSRKIVNHLDKSGLNLRLYQYQTCPFCCKLRAFLDFYGFSYEVVEVNPVTRSQIKFSKEYKKVPILRCKDHVLTESSLVVSQLYTYLVNKNRSLDEVTKMYPVLESIDEKGKKVLQHPNKYYVMLEKTESTELMAAQREEREWRAWVDDWFIHLISPNVYRTWDESLETFKWFEQTGSWEVNFPAWERILAVYVGAVAMFALSKRLKKRHGIVDERQELEKACNDWLAAIGDRKFLGGNKPNLADLSLYGAMNSFVGCAAFKEVIEKHKIMDWFTAMNKAVNSHEGRQLVEARST